MLSTRRWWAIVRKEFLHVLRDRRSLAMAIGLPVLMLVLFGYALTLDVDRVPMLVWDQSGTPASRELISRFTGSRYFALRAPATSYAEIEGAIDRGEALVALVVPRTFAEGIATGRGSDVQFIVDGSDSNTALIASGYADAIALTYSTDLALQQVSRVNGATLLLTPPLDLRPRVWFNAELESKNAIIPGLIAVIMMIIAALITSLTVAREWERGTMEQLISTPVKGPELVLGKLAPYFAVGMFDVLLAVAMGEFVFHVPLRGSVPLLLGTSAVFLVGALSLGMLFSILARNQLLASQLALVITFLPAYLLSGFMFSIANMPKALQLVTYLVPARYFISLLRAIYLKGVGLNLLAADVALLVVFSGTVLLAANVAFRKKLA